MNEQAVVIGNNLRICPAGNTLAVSLTVSDPTHKPAANDPAWLSMPCVEMADLEISGEEKDIFCPQPGIKVLSDRITTKRSHKWKVKFQEVKLLLMQYIMGHDSPDGTDLTFNPNNYGDMKAWVEIKQYDHKNDLWATNTFWAYIKPSNLSFGDSHVQGELELSMLYSSLNDVTYA